jgi:uncharacterized membrane protein HdeD (DUF308 family)
MTTIFGGTLKLSSGVDLAPLRARWGWIVVLGLAYLVTGLIALGSILAATVASVFLVGIMMIVAGVAQIINAFQLKSWGRSLIWALLGALYIVAGFATFENPLFAASVFTLILGAALVASGLVRLFVASSVKHESPWLWLLISSAVTVLLGLLILAHWPVNSVYVLGLFLGLDLVMAGAAWIGFGVALRRGATPAPAQTAKRAW